MMQDPGREEAASSSASSSATPIQSVEQPAPLCSGPAAMAQMGVVASHQHPGAPALGPGPTASAFYGMPFAGPPRQPTPAASQAGPSGGFQGPSYAGHVHCSPAAAAQAGPSSGFQGAVYAGQVPYSPAAAAQFVPSGAGFQGPPYAGQVQYSSAAQGGPSRGYHGVLYTGQLAPPASGTSCGPLHHVPPPVSYAQQITVPQSPAPAAAAACGSPAAGASESNLSRSSQCPRALPQSTARSTFKKVADKCGQCNEMKEDMRLFACSHYPFCNDCIKNCQLLSK
ncbi:Protein mono-ADP-ribosyltransferase PARP4 [Frankliniella fusca]|uniref:Protein mono-ADP-ribosyltransferase PARP4 n=1 Tax=Frankliniella fusca TaxID=407009 RepID=A0AAE1GY26_9NEOP|nr:Protein mono-ADP-ribosyltransferase PARP4 [Frankliniella fusca]